MNDKCLVCNGNGFVSDGHVRYDCPICCDNLKEIIIDNNCMPEVIDAEVKPQEVKQEEAAIPKKRGRPKKNEPNNNRGI